MGLRYPTITGVARDDLPDGGAWLYAETVRQIHALNPGTGVELLIPDFNADDAQLAEVFGSRPEVLAHNLETVPRIFKRIRPAFRYARSLEVLTKARADGLVTKSNLILGMGETPDEVTAALHDLYEAGCEIITITQYLRPTVRHHPVERWVKPQEFVAHAETAEKIGLRRGDGGTAGAVVVPGRAALRPDGRAPRRGALPGAGAPGRRGRRPAGGALAAGPLERVSRIRGDGRARPPALVGPVSWCHGRNAQAGQGCEEAGPPRQARGLEGPRRQIWEAFQMQRREDKKLVPLMVGVFLAARWRSSSASG